MDSAVGTCNAESLETSSPEAICPEFLLDLTTAIQKVQPQEIVR